MSATTFGVRYPSLESPGKLVYAQGAGDLENDPYIAEIQLANSGYYFFYMIYNRVTGEGELDIRLDLYNPNLQDWFPMLNYDREDYFTQHFIGIEGDTKKYRFPFTPFFSEVVIAACETRARVKVGCDGSQLGGWCFLTLITAVCPTVAPHLVDGFTRIPVGSIKVNIEDDLGGWKILHETEFRSSQESVADLGVGAHLITFDDVVGYTPPEDQFVSVIGNQITEISVAYEEI